MKEQSFDGAFQKVKITILNVQIILMRCQTRPTTHQINKQQILQRFQTVLLLFTCQEVTMTTLLVNVEFWV